MSRTTVALALTALLLSCGKTKQQPTGPIANTGPTESTSAMGGDAYGGDAYGGDMYGGDAYGDVYGYDGVEGGVMGGSLPQVNLVGRWVGPCDGSKKAGFTRSTYDITATDWDLRREAFADAACSKRTSSTHLGGTYTADGASTTVPGAWNTSFALTRRDVTADDKKTAAALGKTCGVKLAVGTATDIHAAGCPKLGLRPAADCASEFELVAADGGVLHFGARPADNDVCSAARRPTALAPDALAWRWTTSGVPECDAMGAQYEKLMACTSSALAPEVKNAIRDGVAQMTSMWSTWATMPAEAKTALIDACKAGEQAIVQSAPGMGC